MARMRLIAFGCDGADGACTERIDASFGTWRDLAMIARRAGWTSRGALLHYCPSHAAALGKVKR
ncbi:hypothetical protein KDW75_gp54 [Mycobacterium phage Mercurio]|uniref:Uncharacterized protein n=1 Tax=Mycobacterium phage Mercurio TaxID=2575612 RepID=A0A5J6T6N3_9CAUD|nr:hypothetical protein KDW75_gp54 [Mycobacterium phage Mercurio]QFG06056.1 hypothetical protein PBI_MERCURIO_54 [Mycobacterium phage Mercurio]